MSKSLSIDDGRTNLGSDQMAPFADEVTRATVTGEWLVNVSDQVVVPMTTHEIVERVQSQRLTERSLVWRVGMDDWTALGDVSALRLATGPLSPPDRDSEVPLVAPPVQARTSTSPPPPTQRVLRPPSKEPARAAREERRRRSSLPVGFPVARDPATIREPIGLAPQNTSPSVVDRAEAELDELDALAIYDRPTPTLSFTEAARSDWEGADDIAFQPINQSSTSSSAAMPSGLLKPPRVPVEHQSALTPRRSLELQAPLTLGFPFQPFEAQPQKLRLSLEPQSDPSPDARLDPPFKTMGSQPPYSLAPTTSEPGEGARGRGGVWGDLSVVRASDLRAAKASSKRVTWVASIGSALLASLLTLWFARSSTERAAAHEETLGAPAVAAPAVPRLEEARAAVSAAATASPITSAAAGVSVLRPAALSKPATLKSTVNTPPHVAKVKPAALADKPMDIVGPAGEPNPYAEPVDSSRPKTPSAAFKEPETAPNSPKAADTALLPNPHAPNTSSGLEDGASPVRPAPGNQPGF